MIKPDVAKWNQTISDLYRLSLEAGHRRSRERFHALYMIASQPSNASEWARQIGRQTQTVMGWVHSYNTVGPEALHYRRSGGRPPFFSLEQVTTLVETVQQSEPCDHGLPGYGWSLKKLRDWVKAVWQQEVSRNLLRKILKQNGLSWKKCQKVLKKANPEKRQAYMQAFQEQFHQLCQEQIRIIYIDESHFHRDLDLGYTWAAVGKPAWRLSDCPRLADRINWYGAYDFADGQCLLWNEGPCNGEQTIQFLHRLKAWLGTSDLPVVIIWDNAPCHRAQPVQAATAKLGFTLMPLPGYSPDLNPIEGLWKWMREDVTQLHCYPTMRALFDACKDFIDRINLNPDQILNRLWPKFHLNPEFEKLLLSN